MAQDPIIILTPPEPTPVDSLVQNANEVIGKKSLFIQNLLREDVLNLTLVPINPSLGDLEIKNYGDHVRIYGQEVELMVACIPAKAFENMFLAAGSMYQPGEHYVSGLRIYFGVNPIPEIPALFPVYRPLFMSRVAKFAELGTGEYDPEAGPNFVFTDGEFEAITQEEADLYTATYKSQVTIKHYGEEDFTAFRPGEDVESLEFPFQTIFTLMIDNASNEVYLYNAIRPQNNGVNGIWECILLLPQEKESFFESNNMEGKYANRSKLCPPDCSVVLYEVEVFRGK